MGSAWLAVPMYVNCRETPALLETNHMQLCEYWYVVTAYRFVSVPCVMVLDCVQGQLPLQRFATATSCAMSAPVSHAHCVM